MVICAKAFGRSHRRRDSQKFFGGIESSLGQSRAQYDNRVGPGRVHQKESPLRFRFASGLPALAVSIIARANDCATDATDFTRRSVLGARVVVVSGALWIHMADSSSTPGIVEMPGVSRLRAPSPHVFRLTRGGKDRQSGIGKTAPAHSFKVRPSDTGTRGG